MSAGYGPANDTADAMRTLTAGATILFAALALAVLRRRFASAKIGGRL